MRVPNARSTPLYAAVYWMSLYVLMCGMGSIEVWAKPMPFVIQQQAQVVVSGEQSMLIFDPQTLNLKDALEGDHIHSYVLIRNTDTQAHQIVHIESSCGCTTVEPDTRMLSAGSFTTLHIDIDSFGKRGDVKKSIVLTDELGNQSTVWLYVHIKDNPHTMVSKRSIFDGACAKCHFDPAQGKKTGKAIYDAVCVMCHGQNAKGDYAPKLAGYQNATVLKHIIRSGTGTHHMPAFAQKKGGPLNAKQINALSRWIISLDD